MVYSPEQEVKAYGIENHIFTFNQFDPNSYAKAFRELIKTRYLLIIVTKGYLQKRRSTRASAKDHKAYPGVGMHRTLVMLQK
jgi:serine kinase of HPr protein (carbohydrate metabolism regulator)